MRKLGALFASCILAGCGTYVSEGTVSYNQAIEDETNNLLVTNILRARDGVPTYYSDISQVRGSLQAGVSIPALFGFDAIGKWTARNTIAPDPSLQVAPSFDIAPLNTQEFTRGITEPLDIHILQYYIDRGIPPDVMIYLLVDKIEVYSPSLDHRYMIVDRYYNTPCSDHLVNRCGDEYYNTDRSNGVDVRFYKKIQPWLSYVILNSYTLFEPYGPASKGVAQGGRQGQGTEGGGMNGGGSALVLRPAPGDKFQPYTSSDRVALCVPVGRDREADARAAHRAIPVEIEPPPAEFTEDRALFTELPDQPHYFEIVGVPHTTVNNGPAAALDLLDPQACVQRVVYETPAAITPVASTSQLPGASETDTQGYTLVYLRSVDGIVNYLGKLLRLKFAQRPIKFDVSTTPPQNERLAVEYHGVEYFVASRAPPGSQPDPKTEDRTMDVLTLLNQLINLNKKANELPSTRAVEAVP